MKTKVLFTAALMAAAASGAQAASYTESNMLLQLLESQRYEGVSLLADEVAEQGMVNIAFSVLKNAAMEDMTPGGVWFDSDMGWSSDFGGWNFRNYVLPAANNDIDPGECPYPNAIERWIDPNNQYAANTNIIYQTVKLPNGKYTVKMWAESQDLGDYTHKGGMYVFANDVQQDLDAQRTLKEYTLEVEVTDGQLTLGVRTGENPCDDNHVVLSAVSIETDQAGVEALQAMYPRDIWVTNADCTRNYGWDKNAANASFGYNVNDGALNSAAYAGAGVEYWVDAAVPTQNADLISQEITGLLPGVYQVTAVAMGRNQGAEDVCVEGLYLFANEAQTAVSSNVWGSVTVMGEVGEDGVLRIGLTAGANNANNWVAISQVKVEYVGEDENAALQDALNAKVEEAHALATTLEGQVPTTYLTQLMEVTAPACSTADEYNAAIAEIDALMAEVNAAHTAFANAFLSATNYAEQVLSAFPGAEESAKSTLNSAIEAATTAALASTDATVWAAQAEAVRAATKTYFSATDKVLAEGVSNLDVTQLFMVNPGFEDAENPLEGWNGFAPDVSLGWAQVLCNTHYTPTFDFYQEMAVPNGLYVASVQEHATIGDKTDLYLQSSYQRQTAKMNWNVAVPVENWAENQDENRATTGTVLVTDGIVRIGVNLYRAESRLQLYFDNFRLTLVSDGFTEIKALYDALKLQAEAIETEGMPTVFAKALTDALALPVGTAAQYYTAYNALQKAVADCGTVASVSLPALITECQAYLNNSEGGDEARAALEDALEAAKGYMNLTTAEEIVACGAALETARQAFAKVATPTGEQQFDMTFLLTNPDLTGLVTWEPQPGWYTDTEKKIQCMENHEVASADGKSWFYEIYAGNNTPMPEGNLLYQRAVVPAGSYVMSAYAFGKGVNQGYTGEFSGCLFADAAKGATFNYSVLTESSVSFYQGTEKEIKLGLYSDGTGAANWAGIGYMKLYKVAPVAEELALDETQAYAVTADMYANVTMLRTLKAGHWNTFCVPFDMTPEQLTENGISEVRTFSQAAAQGTSVTLQTTLVSDGVKAGIPYIVKVSGEENVTEISVDGVSVTAAEPASHEIAYSDAGYVEWRGNYSAGTVPMGAYFISDDMFYVADTEVALNGFRAYVMLVDEAGAPVQSNVNRMLIDIDGEVTGIEDVLGDGASDANKLVNVYTVGGVLVKSQVKKGEALDGLQKGAYIVDGKTYLK